MQSRILIVVCTLFVLTGRLSGAVALLVAEPFGTFGAFNPTGHAAIYLSRVCAETPTSLRLCRPGEHGVVISRYHKVAGYDWLAMPVLPYFYAVERLEDVPAAVDVVKIGEMRERYRISKLRDFVPDSPDGTSPKGNWIQLAGAAYERSVYGFLLETNLEDDIRLIEHLSGLDNESNFNLLTRNCADFARGILNFYFPKALRRSLVADAGISTPKQSAKSLVAYARRNERTQFSTFVIPQVPGITRSTRVRGVNESLIRTKKYVVPLVIVQPWVAVSAAVAYLTSGRFDPSKYAPAKCDPVGLTSCIAGLTTQQSTTTSAAEVF